MGCAKPVLRGKFIAMQSYLKKQEKHRIDNLTFHLKQLEEGEQKNHKVSRSKEIIKIRAEINEKETKQTIAKINKVKSESEVTQLCPTLIDPMDCSLPGSSVHGIFQARVLEWDAIAFSPKPMGHCKSSDKGKVHSNTGIPQETRKKSNK